MGLKAVATLVPGGGAPVGGSGTIGKLPKWATTSTLNDSVIAQSGANIGIGTASPNAILSVYNAVTPTISLWNSSNFSRFATSANDLYIDAGLGGAAGATIFRRGSGTVESARIDATGNVGIGTASPTAGRSLTTAADCDIFGLRIGRGLLSEANSTALGASALNATVVGALNNTAVGSNAGKLLTTGVANTFAGYQSGFGTTTGGQNTYFGYSIATGSTSTGSRNTAIGGAAIANISSGSDNVIVGYTAAAALTTGTNNIIIGAAANTSGAAVTNEIVIGASVTGAGSNTTTIGTTATTKTIIQAGTLQLPAGTTARASLNIASGAAPTAPNDGDIWFDGTNIKMRIGGVTKTFTLV